MKAALSKSYKGMFPFRLGTTSFIYPAGYTQNIERIGPFLDEIELLFFESSPSAWPTTAQLSEIAGLGKRFGLQYNIHLPLDISLGHRNQRVRQAAVETVCRLYELTNALTPTTWTLHLQLAADPADAKAVADWRQRTLESLQLLLTCHIPPHRLSLENLNYPIEWIDQISQQTECRMCLDVGHLLVRRTDISAVYRRYAERIDVIHLHGVRNGRDHLSLAELKKQDCRWIPEMLAAFAGCVSLEVFSLGHLLTSLDFFEKLWDKAG